MKKEITLVQALGFAITIVGSMVGIYVSIMSRITAIEIKSSEDGKKYEAVEMMKTELSDIKSSVKIIEYKVNTIDYKLQKEEK